MFGLGLRHCAQLFVGAGIPPRLHASKMSLAKDNNGAFSSSGASPGSNRFPVVLAHREDNHEKLVPAGRRQGRHTLGAADSLMSSL